MKENKKNRQMSKRYQCARIRRLKRRGEETVPLLFRSAFSVVDNKRIHFVIGLSHTFMT